MPRQITIYKMPLVVAGMLETHVLNEVPSVRYKKTFENATTCRLDITFQIPGKDYCDQFDFHSKFNRGAWRHILDIIDSEVILPSNTKGTLWLWTPDNIIAEDETIPNPNTVEPKPMTQPATPTANPYEMMIQDVTNRVMSQVGESVNEAKVQEIVNGILSKQGRLLITIEDKRKTPAELKDIHEPVHKALPYVIGILNSGCWCAVVGPTGSGKTLGALQYAKIAGLEIVCIKQMTNIIAPHDLLGFMDAGGQYRKGAWTDAILGEIYPNTGAIPTMGNKPALICVDEMDNGNPNVSMILKALQTGRIMMPYGLQEVNPNLTVLATLNTWGQGASREYVGRMAQDAALLNEFNFVEWDYDTEFEWTLIQNTFASFKDPGKWTLNEMRRVLDMFIMMRSKAATQKIRCIISTRQIINSVKLWLTNPKWRISEVLHMTVYKGMKKEEIDRIQCPELWDKRHKVDANAPLPTQTNANADCPI